MSLCKALYEGKTKDLQFGVDFYATEEQSPFEKAMCHFEIFREDNF